MSNSVLSYADEVPIDQTVPAVQFGSEFSNDLNEAKRLNVLNNHVHSRHCRACKERVQQLLSAVYGDCRVNFQFPWSSHPAAYASTAAGELLERIRCALADGRGHHHFIKTPLMPPCDYFIPDPPFILEFDEIQHFTQPRLTTLALYPENLESGYSVSRWRELCREIAAKDDQPVDRDERRAWYDTLRDLVPPIHGFGPTVRLYAEEFAWCSLEVGSLHDLETFKRMTRACQRDDVG